MLNSPAIAKQIVKESKLEDDDNPRVQWRHKSQPKSSQIRIPTTSSRDVLGYLKLLEQWAHDTQVALVRLDSEDSKILHAGAAIRRVNSKINAKRRWD